MIIPVCSDVFVLFPSLHAVMVCFVPWLSLSALLTSALRQIMLRAFGHFREVLNVCEHHGEYRWACNNSAVVGSKYHLLPNPHSHLVLCPYDTSFQTSSSSHAVLPSYGVKGTCSTTALSTVRVLTFLSCFGLCIRQNWLNASTRMSKLDSRVKLLSVVFEQPSRRVLYSTYNCMRSTSIQWFSRVLFERLWVTVNCLSASRL